jgi:hypothetical protein
MSITKTQKDTLVIIGGLGALITALVGILTYLNTQEHRELQKKNAHLDGELKLLELELKKSELKKTNF